MNWTWGLGLCYCCCIACLVMNPLPVCIPSFLWWALSPITRLQASTLLFGSRSLPPGGVLHYTIPCYWYPCLSFLLESEPWSLAWYLAWRVMKTLDAHWMKEEGVFSLWNLACGWNYDRWATVRLWRALITKLIFWVNDNCSFHSYSFPSSCNQMKSFPSCLPLISSCFSFSLLLP